MSTKVEELVDYVCPYCFLVEEAVAELKRVRDVVVEILPFELRPDPVPTLKPEDDYLPSVWNKSVYPMARRMGVEIALPSISPQPRTAKAFLVLQLAKEHGLGEAYSLAMFQAFFQQDRNIGDEDVIIGVATSVGLVSSDVRQALTSRDRYESHVADQRHATDTVGVSAVPSFRIGGQLFSGVLNAERLIAAVDEATGGETRP